MNFSDLIKVLGVQRHKITVQNLDLYVQLPTVLEYSKCDTQAGTILHCIVNEDGEKLFSSEDEVNQLDFKYYTYLFKQINEIMVAQFDQDQIEKK